MRQAARQRGDHMASIAEKTIHNNLYSPKVEQKRRELKQLRQLKRNYARNSVAFKQYAKALYNTRALDHRYGKLPFPMFLKHFQKDELELIDNEIRVKKFELRQAKSDVLEDALYYDLSELRNEQKRLQSRLLRFNQARTVKIGKKEISATDYAQKQALKLGECSTLVLVKEQAGRRTVAYRNACKSRICPVCGHFQARKNARELRDAITNKLNRMYATEEGQKQMIHGRLVHMVLTAENVDVGRVLLVKDAWRTIQKQKKRSNKKRANIHAVWMIAPWGFWKFEVTYNEKTGLFHPHLHIFAWVDGWMDEGDNGYWQQIQESWQVACASVGIEAAINFSDRVNGAKVQHLGAVLWFTKETIHEKMMNIEKEIAPAVEEMSKYIAKSNDFLTCTNDADLIDFLAAIHGKVMIAGWGGVRLSKEEDSEGELAQEIEETVKQADDARLIVLRYNKRGGLYEVSMIAKWDSSVLRDFLRDLANYDIKHDIITNFENLYCTQIE